MKTREEYKKEKNIKVKQENHWNHLCIGKSNFFFILEFTIAYKIFEQILILMHAEYVLLYQQQLLSLQIIIIQFITSVYLFMHFADY